jgi:hypothetical protein
MSETPILYSGLSDEYGGNMECILDFVGCSNQKSRDGREAGFTCFVAVKSTLRCSKINKNAVSSAQKYAYDARRADPKSRKFGPKYRYYLG